MKAVILSEFGDTHQLRLTEAKDPVAGPNQVRIAVHAAGTNPVDAGNRADGTWAGLRTPCILGYDIAGVVDQVGSGVSGLALGDSVMAMTHFRDGAGGYAELAVVEAHQAARLHPTTSFVDAAATPVAGCTALTILDRLNLAAGARLLILGASGGVGTFLLQLASARGLDTIAVGRSATHQHMRALGASACIDYTLEDVTTQAIEVAGGAVDAIADLVGGSLLASTLDALRVGGAVATIATPILDLDPILDNNITLHGILIQNDGQRTAQLANLLGSGLLRPSISQVLPLAAAARAHEILERRHPAGKIVLRVR